MKSHNAACFTGMILFLLFSGFFFISLQDVKGQNLAFSQVLLLQRNVLDTVPPGKVWKVEGGTHRSEMCGGYLGTGATIAINGVQQWLRGSGKDVYGNQYIPMSELPLWLPAGTTLRVTDSGGCIEILSIIEFSVTP